MTEPHETPVPRDVALQATYAASKILRAGFGKSQRVSYKGLTNLVTEYDRRSEEAIIQVIRESFPDHTIVAEESWAAADGTAPPAAHRWFVDPLDGTTNFAHGYPVFCTSIAYERDGVLEVGVILDVLRRELFIAERGKGAEMNGTPLHVSTTEKLIHGLFATGFPYERAKMDRALRQFSHMAWQTQGLRRAGAAALSLAYVAAGRLDGFWEATLFPWDSAAGVVMIREAGGAVTRIDGSPYQTEQPDLAASNGLLQAGLLAELAKVNE